MTPEALWVCHRCEMIGSEAEAERHMEATDHPIERLPDDLADAVRHARDCYQGQRVAALLELARLRVPFPDIQEADR